MSGRSRAVAALALAALAGLGACAPPAPRPLPESGTVMQRYRTTETARERLAAGMRAEALVWTRVRGEALPGVEASLALRAPDRLLVSVPSAFGTAVTLSAWDDTLLAFVPSRHAAARVVAARGDLGVRPALALVRLLAATWVPPGAAWDAAVRSDSGWVVRWAEHGDSLRMLVDGDGRPQVIEWRPARGDTLRVRYGSYLAVGGASWPDRTEWSEQRWELRARLRFARVSADPARSDRDLRLVLPAGVAATTREYADLERWWSALTGGNP